VHRANSNPPEEASAYQKQLGQGSPTLVSRKMKLADQGSDARALRITATAPAATDGGAGTGCGGWSAERRPCPRDPLRVTRKRWRPRGQDRQRARCVRLAEASAAGLVTTKTASS
jgi:hypothetical protein